MNQEIERCERSYVAPGVAASLRDQLPGLRAAHAAAVERIKALEPSVGALPEEILTLMIRRDSTNAAVDGAAPATSLFSDFAALTRRRGADAAAFRRTYRYVLQIWIGR